MKLLLSLLTSLCLTSLANAQEANATLDLSKPPTFGEMTKAGMKFEIPGWLIKDRSPRIRSRGAPQPGAVQPAPRQANKLTDAEPSALALAKGESKSVLIAWTSVQCEFPTSELVEPGDYYPPKLPIVDESKIARIHLGTESDDAAGLIKQAAEALKVLGISDPKFDSWVAVEMWKNSPKFDATYESQVPKVQFGIEVDNDEREKKTSARFYLVVGDWEEPAK